MKHMTHMSAVRTGFVDEFVMTGFWAVNGNVRSPPSALPTHEVSRHLKSLADGQAVTRADHRNVSIAFGGKSGMRRHGKARHR